MSHPPMWEPLRRYRALDSEARKSFRRAAVLMPLVGLSLRLRGFKKTQAWLQARLDALPATKESVGAETALADQTCRMVRAAVHYGVPGATCLEESLTLWYLLRRHGIPASLRIGVRKQAGNFEAHAWVQFGESALSQTGARHRHYAAFESEFSTLPEEQP